ncbi:MAG: hypothetical protein RLY97_694 [Pseudomonadota bacterium]
MAEVPHDGPAIPTSIGELVPQARLTGPMPWVIAIMVALTVIAAATGLALRNIAVAASAELSGGITVQIVEAGVDARNAQAQRAMATLRGISGVTQVRLVSAAEIDALIEPWLGGGLGGGLDGGQDAANGDDNAVPVPALIDARLAGGVSKPKLAEIAAQLRAVAPSARLDAQSSWLKPVFGAIASLQWLALALIGLLAAAMAASVLLASRTALGNHRNTIEVIHMLGGTDMQIARIFQRSIGIDALLGGVAGLAFALTVIILVGRRFADLGAGLIEGGALGWLDWAMIGLIPLAGVALAMLTARLSVLAALRKML